VRESKKIQLFENNTRNERALPELDQARDGSALYINNGRWVCHSGADFSFNIWKQKLAAVLVFRAEFSPEVRFSYHICRLRADMNFVSGIVNQAEMPDNTTKKGVE
jgi:hypothetical protein